MAIDVIVKDKKEVKWTGFRSGRSEQLNKLEVSFLFLLMGLVTMRYFDLYDSVALVYCVLYYCR